MKQTPRLDDLELFARVGVAGGLAPVARASGVSVPTLSRRMRALETQLGWQLFERGNQGYGLTAEGRTLLAETEGLLAEARRLRAIATHPARAEVRITAGGWTSAFLARHLSHVWSPEADWQPAFVDADARLDIARRGADIGVRNHRPDQSWMAGRRTARITYAEYAAECAGEGYVTRQTGNVELPSARWVREMHGDAIVATASSARMLADLACAGIGRVVLPRFAAMAFPGLRQVGPVIAALTHEEWLVCHHDARHDPPVRAALDGLAELLTSSTLRPDEDEPPFP